MKSVAETVPETRKTKNHMGIKSMVGQVGGGLLTT